MAANPTSPRSPSPSPPPPPPTSPTPSLRSLTSIASPPPPPRSSSESPIRTPIRQRRIAYVGRGGGGGGAGRGGRGGISPSLSPSSVLSTTSRLLRSPAASPVRTPIRSRISTPTPPSSSRGRGRGRSNSSNVESGGGGGGGGGGGDEVQEDGDEIKIGLKRGQGNKKKKKVKEQKHKGKSTEKKGKGSKPKPKTKRRSKAKRKHLAEEEGGGQGGGDQGGGDRGDHGEGDEDEGEGDELIHDNMWNDYKSIPGLDSYDLKHLADDDEDDDDEMTEDQRRAADLTNRLREMRERRNDDRSMPNALQDHSDSESPRKRTRRGDSGESDGGEGYGGGRGGERKVRGMLDGSDDEADPFGSGSGGGGGGGGGGGERVDRGDGHGGGGKDGDDDSFIHLNKFQGSLREFLAMEGPRLEVQTRFRRFLRYFAPPGILGRYYEDKIKEMCCNDLGSVEVDYNHLAMVNDMKIIAVWVADEPAEMLHLLNAVAYDEALRLYPLYGKVTHNERKDASRTGEVFVRITGLPVIDKICDLRQIHLNALVKVKGIVSSRSGIGHQCKSACYMCTVCRTITAPYQQTTTTSKPLLPSQCGHCGSKGPFTISVEKSIYSNYQHMIIQESPGSVMAGRIPRQQPIILIGDLVDTVTVGEEVEVTGIYVHHMDRRSNVKDGFPVFTTAIQANYVATSKVVSDDFNLTPEDKKMCLKLSREPDIAERIFASMAPSIYGHMPVKRALAMALFGAMKVKCDDTKHGVRDTINVLLLGDPGTAKSQALKCAQTITQRGIFTTGKGASAVGLTASVEKDHITGEFTIKGGAMVLADTGICFIDEFDKMDEKDRTGIHEAMEQQTISISKAGLNSTLKARCSVVAAANPVSGRYDSSATFKENVNLTDPILSRFDILCVVPDTVDKANDRKLAKFVLQSHRKSHPGYTPGDDDYDDDTKDDFTDDRDKEAKTDKPDSRLIPAILLKKYIAFARSRCITHNMTAIDEGKVAKVYSDLRREAVNSGGIPITVRHVESILRMASAHARMHLREKIIDADLDMAIRIMVESFIGSQKFSVKRSLEKYFGRYLVKKEDHDQLIMFVLKGLVKEARHFRELRQPNKYAKARSNTHLGGDDVDDPESSQLSLSQGQWCGQSSQSSRGSQGGVSQGGRQLVEEDPIEIMVYVLETKAKELGITSLTKFFASKVFFDNGFEHNGREKKIIERYKVVNKMM